MFPVCVLRVQDLSFGDDQDNYIKGQGASGYTCLQAAGSCTGAAISRLELCKQHHADQKVSLSLKPPTQSLIQSPEQALGLLNPKPYCWLAGNEGRRYPTSPYILPFEGCFGVPHSLIPYILTNSKKPWKDTSTPS